MREIRVKRTKIAKIALACAVLAGVFCGSCQTARAEEKMHVEGAVDFVDEEGNVMATFIPYSEEDPAPSEFGRATSYKVDFAVNGYDKFCVIRVFELKHGHRIDTNITIDPQVSSNIGLFNHTTGTYGWPAGGLSSSGWYGYIIVNGDGHYSLAFMNNTPSETTYKGTYTV